MLKWVAVHKGVVGNERVDKEAKKAAQGDSSPQAELPPILWEQLLYSASAIKQEFAEKLKARWAETWKASPHFARFQHIDTDFPFNKFWKISNELSRPQASLLMQICTGHIPLNSYLYHIKKSQTRRCDSCWEAGRLEITEMVIHFLFECQTYAAEHFDMDRALGCYSRDLKGILENMTRIKELLKFVGKTARFKKSLGDSIGDVSNLEPEEG